MTEKINNSKLFEGLGHTYRRINARCDRLESQLEELTRLQSVEFDDLKAKLDDILEHLHNNE